MTPDQLERELTKYHKPTLSIDRTRYLRMLLYGTWGVGKTIVACSIGKRPLHLVTEPSDDSLVDWPELNNRVTVVEYGGVNHLRLICEAFESGMYTNDHLIIDTVSELIEEYLDALKVGWNTPRETRPKYEGLKGNQDFTVSGTDDYRAAKDALRPVVTRLCRLPLHVTFIAHERAPTWADDDKLKRQGTPLPPMRPDLPAETLRMIAKRVSVVGRMTRQGDKRALSFRTDNRSKEEVKSRIKALDGERMSDTDFIEHVNKWSA